MQTATTDFTGDSFISFDERAQFPYGFMQVLGRSQGLVRMLPSLRFFAASERNVYRSSHKARSAALLDPPTLLYQSSISSFPRGNLFIVRMFSYDVKPLKFPPPPVAAGVL